MGNRHLRGSTERCPKCASKAVAFDATMSAHGYGPGLAVCQKCKAMWEPFFADEIWDKSDPICSFREPCNNCAFRPGSHEQADRDRWLNIIDGLKLGAMFYCHKDVPIEPGAEHGFAYPSRVVVSEIAGERIETRVEIPAKMRICRGFLNAAPTLWKKRAQP